MNTTRTMKMRRRSFRLATPSPAAISTALLLIALLVLDNILLIVSFVPSPRIHHNNRRRSAATSAATWRTNNNHPHHPVPRTLVCYYSSISLINDDLYHHEDDVGITITNKGCTSAKMRCLSSSPIVVVTVSVVIRTERRRMYRLSRLNRMLTLHANKPSTTRMEDTDESNTTDDGTSTNDVALNGTVNEDETANDTLVTDTDTASSTDDDDQPTYRSKLRLTTLPASRRNTKTPSKSLYRQLPSIQQKQKHPLPSIQQKQQTEKQKTNQGVLPLTNSTRNKISTTSSSSTSSYEQRKRQLAENQQQRPNPTATTGQQQQKSKQKEPQSTSQQQQPQNTNKTNTTKPTTTNEQLITQRLNEEFSIDSFLRGDYDRPFDNKQAPAPHPGLTPGDTVNIALRALRALNVPEVDHGAAVFRTFCAELSRNDRWGGGVANTRGLKGGGCEGSSSSSSSIRRGNGSDSSTGEEGTPKNSGISLWKEILRGALTPTMFARRIRASDEFSILLDWERLDVTDGMAVNPAYYAGREWDEGQRQLLGIGSTVAFVNAAMFFGEGVEPSIVQVTLVRMSGVWLIDTAVVSKKEWFMDDGDGDDGYEEEEEQEQEFDDGDA